jgi:hypothetical protein
MTETTKSFTRDDYEHAIKKQKKKRRVQLKAIRGATYDLESALLTLKNTYKVKWADDCFDHLYYLQRLARKAP